MYNVLLPVAANLMAIAARVGTEEGKVHLTHFRRKGSQGRDGQLHRALPGTGSLVHS